jgi:hypothetical protein
MLPLSVPFRLNDDLSAAQQHNLDISPINYIKIVKGGNLFWIFLRNHKS